MLFHCKAWTTERKKIHEKCKENGVGEQGTIKQLLSLRKATPALLGFIAVMRVEQRVQSKEQKRRQKERERDKAWSLEAERLEGDEKEETEEERDQRGRGGER